MFRAAAFVIVLALSAAPIAGVVCGLRCESQASAAAPVASACHGHAASTRGPAINGIHVCDHDISFAAFVVQTEKSLAIVAVEHAITPVKSASSELLLATTPIRGTSPPGSRTSPGLSGFSVLRI